MARRERGAGSIYQDNDRPARWIGEVTIAGRRRRVSGPSKSAVRAKLDGLRASGTPTNRQVTVAQTLDDWLDRALPDRQLAASTAERHNYSADLIRDEIGKTRLAVLDVRAIETMLDRLGNRKVRPLSWASQKWVLQTLMLAIDYAVDRGDVADNVARRAKVSPKAKRPVGRTALQPDDARRLLDALRHERNGAMFAFGLLIGVRPGEAAALWWDDIDLDADPPTVNVTRGRQVVGGVPSIVDDLKTKTAKRTIAITTDLADWLRQHRHEQTRERLASHRWDDPRLVFGSANGTVRHPSNDRRELTRICKSADIPVVTPNELRHSCASLLADEGVPNEAIADLLGHTTTRMVDGTYRHRLRPIVDVATRAIWTDAQ